MLTWLDNFFSGVSSTIGSAISNAVHWAIHAVSAVFLAVFSLVGKAWNTLVSAIVAFHIALQRFGTEVINFATYVVRVLIPKLARWAESELAKLKAYADEIYDWAKKSVADLITRIEQAVKDVTDWVIKTVYDPLKAYADLIWNDLKLWGYTAWWWVTHLQDLADAMIVNIATSLEKNAWALAKMLGEFALNLVRAHLKEFIQLAEDIITAVL